MFDGPLQDAIDELSRLPGIGPKGAQRIAFHLIDLEDTDVQRLLGALAALQGGVQYCTVCHNVSVEDLCTICADRSRDASTICVVEEAKDIQVIEKSGEYQGRYHVLGGALDPLAGIGPKELTVALLAQRVGAVEPHIKEVILAMDPNTEGEATAAYITRLLKDFPGLVISRLASGIPMGGDLEFVDELTLARSLRERRTLTA